MEEERNYTVYMHVCMETEKVYVGITCLEPKKRWKANGDGYKTQLFGRAVRKYGWENFEHIILAKDINKKKAEELEKLYIKIFLSNNNKFGYNIELGGNGNGSVSEQTKLKLRKINLGLKHSDETIQKMKKYWENHVNPTAKQVICDGEIFDSINNCAIFYNINPNVMYNWFQRCIMPQKFIDLNLRFVNDNETIYKPQVMQNRIKVFCDNKVYPSITKCAEVYGIKMGTMSAWLNKKHNMPQEFIDLGLRYLDNEDIVYASQDKPQKRKIICDNIMFESITECADFYSIKRNMMNEWLLGKRRMPQNFIDLGLHYIDNENITYRSQDDEKITRGKKVICDNQIFKSIAKCADYYEVDARNMRRWINRSRPMPQKFLNMGLSYYIEEENENIKQSA